MADMMPPSTRKFWPKRRRATWPFIAVPPCAPLRPPPRGGSPVGPAGAGEFEGRCRGPPGADDGQPQGDVDAAAEGGVFEGGQTLVVVQGQHGVARPERAGEHRIGRQRPQEAQPGGPQLAEDGFDDIDLLPAPGSRLRRRGG